MLVEGRREPTVVTQLGPFTVVSHAKIRLFASQLFPTPVEMHYFLRKKIPKPRGKRL